MARKFRNSTRSAHLYDFLKVEGPSVRRSTFTIPHRHTTSIECGKVYPVCVSEVLPGDTFEIDLGYLARTVTPVFPTMDNLEIEFRAFYAPSRILWDGFINLMGENTTGAWRPTTPPALVPRVIANTDSSGDFSVKSLSLADYMGLPVGLDLKKVNNTVSVSALPFRMYYLMWNQWFRDENFQAPIQVYLGDDDVVSSGSPFPALYEEGSVLPVCKPKDYFTSALPEPQKGPNVPIPVELNQLIPVIAGTDRVYDLYPDLEKQGLRFEGKNGVINPNGSTWIKAGFSGGADEVRLSTNSVSDPGPGEGPYDEMVPNNLFADPRNSTFLESSISDLRTAIAIQRIFEKDARFGTRYKEVVKGHFGVDVADGRVQYVEELGRYRDRIGVYQVPQTSGTTDTSPQGNMAAFGYGDGSTKLVNKSFVEHGYVMIVAWARQRKTYQQGLERFWSRRERFDFYFPALAHISEQPIYNREIYVDNTAKDNEIFGYQEAWADYRFKPNRVSGLMRAGVDKSLSAYNYADYYSSRPYLSDTFIRDNSAVNFDRTVAAPVEDSGYQIILDMSFNNKATRPMPIRSTPGLMDHF